MERMKKEELEKLKDFKVYAFEGDVYVKAEDYKKIAIENKKLREERDLYKARNEELNENCFGLAKGNENLKSDLAFERTMLDNVRAEYKRLQDIIKKLNEENETLKEELISRIRQPKNVPYGKGVAELMEEDTLQELRDIGEI